MHLIHQTTGFFLSHVFATIKSKLFLSLFFVVYIPLIVYNSYVFVNFLPNPVDRHSRLIYEANLLNNNFNHFNKFLTILKCSVDLDFEFNVTADRCMHSNFYVVDCYSLAQFIRLNFFKALTPQSTSIGASPDPLFLCLLFFFSMFSYLFSKNWHNHTLND